MLTLAHKKTEKFIRQFVEAHGYSPTASEIAAGIGIKSRGVVHRYLKALASAGRIALTPKRHRNIRLLDPVTSLLDSLSALPLVGTIAAGRPIEAVPQQEHLDIAKVFAGMNRYALQVKGDSMIDEGIFDGDIVICEKADTADNGQIVVALIDHEAATLKRLQRNKDATITLLPANSALEPMVYDAERITVQGIYVGLVRY
jgi:repressor LexA